MLFFYRQKLDTRRSLIRIAARPMARNENPKTPMGVREDAADIIADEQIREMDPAEPELEFHDLKKLSLFTKPLSSLVNYTYWPWQSYSAAAAERYRLELRRGPGPPPRAISPFKTPG